MLQNESRSNRWKQQANSSIVPHDMTTVRYDLPVTIRGFLKQYQSKLPVIPRAESVSTKRDKSKESIPMDQLLTQVVRISVEDHVYWKQWKTSNWSISDIADATQVVAIHELQSLALHGKGLWVLYMILQHGKEDTLLINADTNKQVLRDTIEVLLEVAITQSAYTMAISALKMLVTKYNVPAPELFAVGVGIKARIPEQVEDLNFMSLLHFSHQCVQRDHAAVHNAIKLLLFLSMKLICSITSNYFLSRAQSLLFTGLSLKVTLAPDSETSIAQQCLYDTTLSVSQKRHVLQSFGNTVVLLRILCTRHVPNCEFVGKSQVILQSVLTFLQRPLTQFAGSSVLTLNLPMSAGHSSIPSSSSSSSTHDALLAGVEREMYESIGSECLLLINALVAALPGLTDFFRSHLPLSMMTKLAGLGLPSLNSALCDVYLSLYETSLPYCDEEGRYAVAEERDHLELVEQLLQSVVRRITRTIDRQSEDVSVSMTLPLLLAWSPITANGLVQLVDTLHSLLLRLETSLRVASDCTLLLDVKLEILRFVPQLLGIEPSRWDLRFVKLVDILLLLSSGAESMWSAPFLHIVDQGFIDISQQLVQQFSTLSESLNSQHISRSRSNSSQHDVESHNVNSDAASLDSQNQLRGFDVKDCNTLLYLAGNDAASTIPAILQSDFNKPPESDQIQGGNSGSWHASSGCAQQHIFTISSALQHEEVALEGAANQNKESSGSLSRTPQRIIRTGSRDVSADCSISSHSPMSSNHLSTTHSSAVHSESHTPQPQSPIQTTSPSMHRSRSHPNVVSACGKVALTTVQSYLQHWRILLESFFHHLPFLAHIASSWVIESPLTNYRKICYSVLVVRMIGVKSWLTAVHLSHPGAYCKLLWGLLNDSKPSKEEVFFAWDMHDKSIQLLSLLIENHPAECEIQSENLQKQSGLPNSEKSLTPNENNQSNSDQLQLFQDHVALSEWLTNNVITQRSGALKQQLKSSSSQRDGNIPEAQMSGLSDALSADQSPSLSISMSPSLQGDDLSVSPSIFLSSSTFREPVTALPDCLMRASVLMTELENERDRQQEDSSYLQLVVAGIREQEKARIRSALVECAVSTDDPVSESGSSFNFEQSCAQTWIAFSPSLSLHFTCLQALFCLSLNNRTVRRKLVATCFRVIDSLYAQSVSSNAINFIPMLRIIYSMSEFVPKLEIPGEEAIVGLVIRSLSSPRFYVQAMVCDLIYCLGQESPGFVFRGLSRREVEEPLLQLFLSQQAHYEAIRESKQRLNSPRTSELKPTGSSPTTLTERKRSGSSHSQEKDDLQPYALLLLNALKACTVLVHNFNIKPIWLPSPFLYHWQHYRPVIANRALMSAAGLTVVTSVLQHAAVPFRLACFAYSLSLSSSIMYAFSDGMLTPADEIDRLQLDELKAVLVSQCLPWLPLAIDFIALGKRKKRERRGSNTLTGGNANPSECIVGLSEKVSKKQGPVDNASMNAEDSNATTIGMTYNNKVRSPLFFVNATLANGNSRSAVNVKSSQLMEYILRHQKKQHSVTDTVQKDDNGIYEQAYKTKAIEMLAERTVESIYAFLCTDDMFPLSTYLQNIDLFQSNSLVASISYFMTEFRDNAIILRRGLDFLRYFADYQMNISSIAMHAPLALLLAYTFHKEVSDVQLSFAKIILVIVMTHDDFAKENVIRFNIHTVLVELINLHRSELTRLGIQAMVELIFNENHGLLVQELDSFLDALISVINDSGFSKDLKVHYEAVRAFVLLDFYVPNVIAESSKRQSIFAALRKSRKFLMEESRKLPLHPTNGNAQTVESDNTEATEWGTHKPVSGKSPQQQHYQQQQQQQYKQLLNKGTSAAEVDRKDIDLLLNSRIWSREKCSIS